MDMTIVSTLMGMLFWRTPVVKMPPAPPVIEEPAYKVVKSYVGEVTAYSSREEETDDTPFIAASGNAVHWGMVATNAYPFGTELRFPDLYIDKIFVVKDRMNTRYQNRFDIWFPEHEKAVRFGIKNTRVEIVRKTDAPNLAVK